MSFLLELPDDWEDHLKNYLPRDRTGYRASYSDVREWFVRLIEEYRHKQTHNFEFPTESSKAIFRRYLPAWSDLFLKKNADYGETGDLLGSRGQFADMWRKFGKLKRALWDGKALTGEQPDEIILDLIGHAFLTLYFLEKEQEALIDGEAEEVKAAGQRLHYAAEKRRSNPFGDDEE